MLDIDFLRIKCHVIVTVSTDEHSTVPLLPLVVVVRVKTREDSLVGRGKVWLRPDRGMSSLTHQINLMLMLEVEDGVTKQLLIENLHVYLIDESHCLNM